MKKALAVLLSVGIAEVATAKATMTISRDGYRHQQQRNGSDDGVMLPNELLGSTTHARRMLQRYITHARRHNYNNGMYNNDVANDDRRDDGTVIATIGVFIGMLLMLLAAIWLCCPKSCLKLLCCSKPRRNQFAGGLRRTVSRDRVGTTVASNLDRQYSVNSEDHPESPQIVSLANPVEAEGPAWTVGDVVDIDTEDGWELGARIVGPSKGGQPGTLQVLFKDGVVDDWDVEDFRAHQSPA
eukprot:COSAG01_NODE_4061_length_5387_cov_199.673979_1_plen_241_part_00